MTSAKNKSKSSSQLEEAIEYQIGIRELRQDASRVVALVEKGASITITRHGKVVATINPPQQSKLEDLIARGATLPKSKKLNLRNWKVDASPVSLDLIDAIHQDLRQARY
jgi:antitoxin (DNA-binding transcriptional repressor) of toxin-antitoxin stability system